MLFYITFKEHRELFRRLDTLTKVNKFQYIVGTKSGRSHDDDDDHSIHMVMVNR